MLRICEKYWHTFSFRLYYWKLYITNYNLISDFLWYWSEVTGKKQTPFLKKSTFLLTENPFVGFFCYLWKKCSFRAPFQYMKIHCYSERDFRLVRLIIYYKSLLCIPEGMLRKARDRKIVCFISYGLRLISGGLQPPIPTLCYFALFWLTRKMLWLPFLHLSGTTRWGTNNRPFVRISL